MHVCSFTSSLLKNSKVFTYFNENSLCWPATHSISLCFRGQESPQMTPSSQGHCKSLPPSLFGKKPAVESLKGTPMLPGHRWIEKHTPGLKHIHNATLPRDTAKRVFSFCRHYPGLFVLPLSGQHGFCASQDVSVVFCSLMNFALEFEDGRHELNMLPSRS